MSKQKMIYHLMNFHFVDKTGTTIFDIVSQAFNNPLNILIYIAAMVIAALHVSHSFWSAFQTLGTNHPKYMPMIRTVGLSILSMARETLSIKPESMQFILLSPIKDDPYSLSLPYQKEKSYILLSKIMAPL